MAEAEDKALFVLTRRVKEALGLINALEESKLSVIVRRLVKRIGEKGAPFSATELEQLQEVLELAESQVDTVLEGCAFFLEQSAYHVIKPEQLSAHLQAAGMIQSHARAFSGAWEAEATGVLRRLRALSQGIHPTLESLDWRLHVQTASSGLTKLAEPRAVVSLKLKSHDDKDEVVPLELDRAQMAELLTQLDAAQQQLDALS